jgi:hypothetical protein
MTDTEFFTLTQEQWFQEYIETQLPQILTNSYPHRDFFEFDDLPF